MSFGGILLPSDWEGRRESMSSVYMIGLLFPRDGLRVRPGNQCLCSGKLDPLDACEHS